MIQKIMLALEINDEALDKAQAKVDKLIQSLEYAEGLMDEIGIFANPPIKDEEKPLESRERENR